MNQMKISTLALAGFLGLISIPAAADINMGVFSRCSSAVTYKAFKPLAEKLSQ